MGPSPLREARVSGDLRSFAPFVLAFAVIASGFLASTLYSEHRSSQIDQETAQIETNSLPSVEHLVAAEAALRRLEVASEQYARGTGDAQRAAELAIDAARATLDEEMRGELATGMYPGEAELAAVMERNLRDLDGVLLQLKGPPTPEGAGVARLSPRDLWSVVERTDEAIDRLMALNAAQAHAQVARITRIREGSVRVALWLDTVCIAFSMMAALVALRALRGRRAVELANEKMLATRAEELEVFAQRVAHDLLGPLSALAFTLSSVRRNSERGVPIDEPLQRAGACLKRSQRLVNAVLDFARSAASSAPGERTSRREAIDGVVEEVRAEASEGVEIAVARWSGDVVFPCAPGILGSVLSNLVRNAVKYVGEGDEKRVTIRVLPNDEGARVEVEDNGPGLTSDLAAHVFEPYVRAPDNAKPGLGLGLATVRRFVEAHGGRVGVDSSPGTGSIFWFRLPRAPGRVAAAAPALPLRNGVTER
jgi:signal transduction histidine kinase